MKKENERFECIHREGSSFGTLRCIFVDKVTGVNYLFMQSGYSGGLTPLLDRDGNPVISTIGYDSNQF